MSFSVYEIQGDQKVSVHLTITIPTQLMIWRWPSQNTFGMWTVLYWTRSSRTQFGMSINVWRLAGDTLNITCNFLYCNHQVHRDFLITLYKDEVFFAHTAKAYRGVDVWLHWFLTSSLGGSECASWHLAVWTPAKSPSVIFEYKARWALEQIYKYWRREKSLLSTGIRTSVRPASSLVAVPNALPSVSSDHE